MVRSPLYDVSLLIDHAPTTEPEVMSLGAGVGATRMTPGPTGGIVKLLPGEVTAAAAPTAGDVGALDAPRGM